MLIDPRSAMILTCPNCAKRYQIADGTIGSAGRTVRCAACGHGWHQAAPAEEPERAAVAPLPDPLPPPPDREADPQPPAAGPTPPPSWAEPPPRAARARAADPDDRPAARFAPERRARRNPEPFWNAAAIVIALILIALILMTKPGGIGGVDLGKHIEPVYQGTALRIAAYEPIWGRVVDGRNLLTVNGRIENPARRELPVPPLRARLRDAEGTLLASWTSPAPLAELPAGSAIGFDTAAIDAPAGAATVEVELSTPRD